MNPNTPLPGTSIRPDSKPEEAASERPPESVSSASAPTTESAPAPEPEPAKVEPVPGLGAASYTPPPAPPKSHNKRNRLLFAAGIVAVLTGSGAAFALNQPDSEDIVLSPEIRAKDDADESTPPAGPSKKQTVSPAPAATPAPGPAAAVPAQNPPAPAPASVPLTISVSYTDDGFSPASFTIKQGGTVTFVNNSGGDFWPDANDHPEHTQYPEFDPGAPIAAGGSWSFKFDKVGEWDYHNHLKPTEKGTVTVQ